MGTYRRKMDARDKLTPAEKRKRAKELEEERKEDERKKRAHKRFLRKVGYRKRTKKEMEEAYQVRYREFFGNDVFPETQKAKLPVDVKEVLAAAKKRDILNDHKWKKDKKESPETIKEINKKSKRVASAYNKGGLQYVTDKTDAKTIGKK